MNYVWVAVGSALGGMARYWCSGFVAQLIGEWFPWGTLIVNISGSFVIGVFAALSAAEGPFLIPPKVRIFVMVGICGGYTTFSFVQSANLRTMARGPMVLGWGKLGALVRPMPACRVARLRRSGCDVSVMHDVAIVRANLRPSP
jgi:fluoride exporter